jgi:hypothetical protein
MVSKAIELFNSNLRKVFRQCNTSFGDVLINWTDSASIELKNQMILNHNLPLFNFEKDLQKFLEDLYLKIFTLYNLQDQTSTSYKISHKEKEEEVELQTKARNIRSEKIIF